MPASAPFKVYVDAFADVGRLAEGVDADALFDSFLVDEMCIRDSPWAASIQSISR